MYSEVTSRVASMAPSGMGPNLVILLMKSWVSLMWDFVFGTYSL